MQATPFEISAARDALCREDGTFELDVNFGLAKRHFAYILAEAGGSVQNTNLKFDYEKEGPRIIRPFRFRTDVPQPGIIGLMHEFGFKPMGLVAACCWDTRTDLHNFTPIDFFPGTSGRLEGQTNTRDMLMNDENGGGWCWTAWREQKEDARVSYWAEAL